MATPDLPSPRCLTVEPAVVRGEAEVCLPNGVDANERLSILLFSTSLSSESLPTMVELKDRRSVEGERNSDCSVGTTIAESRHAEGECSMDLHTNGQHSFNVPVAQTPTLPENCASRTNSQLSDENVSIVPSASAFSTQSSSADEDDTADMTEAKEPDCKSAIGLCAGESSENSSRQKEWLRELSVSAELETMSILYAKSILEPQLSVELERRVAIGR